MCLVYMNIFSVIYKICLFTLYNIANCKSIQTMLSYRHRGDTNVQVKLKAQSSGNMVDCGRQCGE